MSSNNFSKRSPPPHSYGGSPPEGLSASQRERIKKEAEDAIFERVGEKRKSEHDHR